MSGGKRVGILSERLRAYGRQICEGVAAFAQTRDDWSLGMIEWEDLAHPSRLKEFDGFVARVLDETTATLLARTGKPVVDVYGSHPRKGFAIVDHDARLVGQLAARHFIEHRFTRFAYLGYNRQPYSNQRRRFFVHCLSLNHFHCEVYGGKDVSPDEFAAIFLRGERYSSARDTRAVATWVARLDKPVAVFCSHDLRAHQLLSICRDIGISVPDEVAILGVDDDSLICNFTSPSLSSIDPNAFRIGQTAAATLDAWLDDPGRTPGTILVPPAGLTIRGSTETYPLDPSWLSTALVFIRRNIARRLTASDVFSEIGLSHTIVERAFRRVLGVSVQNVIQATRVEESKRLLSQTRLSLAEVSKLAGFSSMQYFCTEFRIRTGQTPLQYRKSGQTCCVF